MHYVFLVAAPLMWSFVGILVKIASTTFSSSVVSLSRFLFGTLFLGILLLVRDGRIRINWRSPWIWMGALAKSMNYITENIALRMGEASGNMVVPPLQAIFIAMMATLFFREKMTPTKGIAVVLCMSGSMLISLRGQPLAIFFMTGLVPLLLFVLSAIGSGIHVISQKKLMAHMESANMNFSVFLLSTLVTLVPVPFNMEVTGPVTAGPVLALVGLGFITGISFMMYAIALKKVSLLPATLVGNSAVLFILLWAGLLYGETINSPMILGALVMVVGLVLINLPFPSGTPVPEKR